MKGLRDIRGYPWYLAAVTLSTFGTASMILVLGVWMKDVTGSNSMVALTTLFTMVPALLGPVVAYRIDRLTRRSAYSIGAGVCSLALLALVQMGDLPMLLSVWLVAFAYGLGGVLMNAAVTAVVKELVAPELLGRANALVAAVVNGVSLLSPLAGVGLYSRYGLTAVAMLDLSSFVLSTALLVRVRASGLARHGEATDLRSEMVAGLAHVVGHRGLRRVTLSAVLIGGTGGLLESAMFSVLDVFDQPATSAGYVVTVQGLGMIFGGLLALVAIDRFGEVRCILVAETGCAGCAVAGALSGSFAIVLVVMFSAGCLVPVIFTAFDTYLMRRTSSDVLGRVNLAVSSLFTASTLVFLVVGAVAIASVNFRPLYLLVGLVCLVSLLPARRVPADVRVEVTT